MCLEKRLSYRRLRKEFGLDDETLEDVRHELIVKRLAVDESGEGLAFVGAALSETGDAPPPAFASVAAPITLPLVLSAPLAPVARAAIAAAPDAERRQLTVMFCDLVGSTALSTGMDPEDLRDVITSFQNRCSAAIRRYDGFVAKYMGDGILVYFGYPRAHEDEAERSARAGLDIVDAMAELNAAIRRPPGVELAVRITVPRSRSNALSLVRKSGSHWTHRWREQDSNHRSPADMLRMRRGILTSFTVDGITHMLRAPIQRKGSSRCVAPPESDERGRPLRAMNSGNASSALAPLTTCVVYKLVARSPSKIRRR